MEELFSVGGPVTGKGFYGRREALGEIKHELVEKKRLGYAVYGPRRIGKTSLLKELERELRKSRVVQVVYLDVSGVHPFTAENFYDQLLYATVQAILPRLSAEKRLWEALKGSGEAVARLLRDAEVSVCVKDYLEVRLRLREEKASLQQLLAKTMNSIESLARESKTRVIVVLDEFQFAEKLEPNITWAIRSAVQEWKNASIMVSGSEVSLLEQMILPKTAPFYLLLKPLRLGPFDEKTSRQMIEDKFKKAGIKYDADALHAAFELTGGFPYYLQWLGDKLYDLKASRVTAVEVGEAFEALLDEGEVLFLAELEKLAPAEKEVLIELA
ncbi:MAG: ATP-binding protein, partial [Candidatus Micrarchaeota archaeon]